MINYILILLLLCCQVFAFDDGRVFVKKIYGEKEELKGLQVEAEAQLFDSQKTKYCPGNYSPVKKGNWYCHPMVDYPKKFICDLRYMCLRESQCIPGERDVESCSSEIIKDGMRLRTCNEQGSDWGPWGECQFSRCDEGYELVDGKCQLTDERQQFTQKFKKDPEQAQKEWDERGYKLWNFAASIIKAENDLGDLITTDFAWTPIYQEYEYWWRFNVGGHLFKKTESSVEKVFTVWDFEALRAFPLSKYYFLEVGGGLQYWALGGELNLAGTIGAGYKFKKRVKVFDRLFINMTMVLADERTTELKGGLGISF